MRRDSLLRIWRYINHLLTYLWKIIGNFPEKYEIFRTVFPRHITSIIIMISLYVCVYRYVILELVETEKDYVRDLGLVVEVNYVVVVLL